MPASLTTCWATARSRLISSANCSGVLIAGTRLRAVRWRSRNAGSLTMLATSLESLSTIGLRRAGRREQAVPAARRRAVVADLGQQRHVREVRRADVVHHDQRRHRAGLDVADDVALAEQRDRRRAAQDRVDRLAAALERHAHPVGALLLLQRLHVEHERRRRARDSSACRPSPSTARSARRRSSRFSDEFTTSIWIRWKRLVIGCSRRSPDRTACFLNRNWL